MAGSVGGFKGECLCRFVLFMDDAVLHCSANT